MPRMKARCPACGAPIEYRIGTSLVTVCEHCHSAVARTNRKLEDLGRVAELTETESPLQVGLRGKYKGKGFELTGRVQYQHSAGGVWDEWYAAFANGTWGWLAEAQGKFYLTVETPLTPETPVPARDELAVGAELALPKGVFSVTEVGVAKTSAGEGEIPYRFVPGTDHPFADLAGPDDRFATLDYSGDEPTLYLGREVTLDALGLADVAKPDRPIREVSAVQLNCPQCAGTLDLRAPDQSARVTCPHCLSLLDVSSGKLSYLQTLTETFQPLFQLGSQGTLDGVTYTVLGALRRSVTYDGVDYYWTEYLLYEPRKGYRWIVESDGHFTFVEPASQGKLRIQAKQAVYDGATYQIFQDAIGTVRGVLGEFYWKVEAGESVAMKEFIRPPHAISVETTLPQPGAEGSQERTVSRGTYLPHAAVTAAFGATRLPAAIGIAPTQPFPYPGVYALWGLFVVVLIVLGGIFMASGFSGTPAYQQTFTVAPGSTEEHPQVVFSEKAFPLRGRRNIEVIAAASVDNSWIFLAGDLYNEQTGMMQSFGLPVEYYHGSDGDGPWTEGSRRRTAFLSALPAGDYHLRIEAQSGSLSPQDVTVTIRQGVARPLNWFLALAAVSVVPLLVGVYQIWFETTRWKDSEFSSSNQEE